MNKKRMLSASWLVLFFVLSACSPAKPQSVEVTRIVPQTVEVTREVTQIVTSTPISQVLPSVVNSPFPTAPEATSIPRNQIYNYGIIVITQYYTFLGHGLYSGAYNLLSSSARKHDPSEKKYVDEAQQAFKTVKINNIQPFIESRTKEGPGYIPSPGDEYKFTVDIVAWGIGSMSGSVPSGQPQEFWITIVQENGEWKIDQFATA